MAANKLPISATVAFDIGARSIATWNDAIARSPRVLVPVVVEALTVRAEGGTWANCTMTPPLRGSNVQAPDLLPDPFAERDPRQAGVYLHWALPDALTTGAISAASPDAQFPTIPDRWLVARISSAVIGGRRPVAAWMIEAGDDQPTVTLLDDWNETADPESQAAPGEQQLTALGHGDAAWAGYFDNVQNRFAFYDDLTDAAGPLAYLVCGWHSRHVDDPIGEALNTPAEFEARLADLGWEIDPSDIEAAFSYTTDRVQAATQLGLATREARFTIRADVATGKQFLADGVAGESSTKFTSARKAELGRSLARAVSWPEFCLYHGGVVGIGWPEAGFAAAPKGLLGGDAGGPPLPEDVSVCIGSTLTEALSTALAHNTGHPDEARILEAVLLGGTDELDQPDGATRIDSRLHANAFASLPDGATTESIPQTASTQPTSVVADPSQTDPGVFPPPPPAPPPTGGPAVPGQLLGKVGEAPATLMAPMVGSGNRDSVLTEIKRRMVAAATAAIPSAPNAPPPTQTVSVQRARPRYFLPTDPVFLLQGAGRSFKHSSDSTRTESNKLACRLSGETVRGFAVPEAGKASPGTVGGGDLLAGSVDHGSVPPECNDLLRELSLLDPGSASTIVRSAAAEMRVAGADETQLAGVVAVHQSAWWLTRDERRDEAQILATSGFSGTLPAPVAISLPSHPWTPLHLDWEVELFAATDIASWTLGEIDFAADADALPAADAEASRTLSGRALLTGGAAQVAAATVRKVLEQAQQAAGSGSLQPGLRAGFNSNAAREMLLDIGALRAAAGGAPAAAADGDNLDNIADELDRMDVLVGAMDRFDTKLRAGFVADRIAAPAPGTDPPADFWPLRSGFMRVKRLRLVDCFGQVLDLAGSGANADADMSEIDRSEPLEIAGRSDLLELAPRFTAPSRLWFRFVGSGDDTVEATDAISPLCGFLLPNHLDGDLQFHGADGTGFGAVRFDETSGVVWEDSPGRPTTTGKSPSAAVDNAHLGAVAQGLLDWGAVDATPDAPSDETALSALLRIVDTSLWAVDPFAQIGEEHLALLVGHPITVMRAMVKVDVAEPVTPAEIEGIRVPVRIGALAHWQDGLLAYFAGDDYRTLRIPDPAAADFARPVGPNQGFNQPASETSDYYANFAADLGVVGQKGNTPVDHPYVDTSGLLWLQPGQEVMLTLLIEPHCVVHATTGYLPRKEIGMRRAWTAPGLARLAPVFRFGPVVVDPKLIRMPVPTDIRGTWSWSHRANVTTWTDDPITNANGDARIPPDPSVGEEGWLKLSPDPPETSS